MVHNINFVPFNIPSLMPFIGYLSFSLSSPNQKGRSYRGIYVHTCIFNILGMDSSDTVIYFNHPRVLAIQTSGSPSHAGYM